MVVLKCVRRKVVIVPTVVSPSYMDVRPGLF